jgi:hypothetical protein
VGARAKRGTDGAFRPLPPTPSLKGRGRRLFIFLSLLLSFPAHATEPKTQDQLAGLFIQGCLPFAGNSSALRAWAATNKLPVLPDPATKTFLLGAPGRAFDASAPGAKLALASSDDGLCSAITDKATSTEVAQALETGLTHAGAAFRLVIDRDDPKAKELHFREYLATRLGRSWRILAATVNDPAGGQAMLTAAPE